ncbi:MAG: 6-pyruvoyl-tetrahydropterin synthase-related protein [Anaerolineae bacterium]
MRASFRFRLVPYAMVLLFSVFIWLPLLSPAYFFNAHDAPHSVFFLVEFDQTLRDGYLWPRWSPDFAFGYGYPLFNLYAPLAFYAAELLHLMGLSFVEAVKGMYILATIVGGIAMCGFLTQLMGSSAGVVGAVLYMWAPFHLLEIYVRSAFPEYVALALLPVVMWAFTSLVRHPSGTRLAWAGLSYGLLALTHHASLLTLTPFIGVYVLFLALLNGWTQRHFHGDDRHRFITLWLLPLGRALAAALLGLGLAAVYLLPLVTELQYVKVEQWTAYSYDYRQHFVYPSQLLSPVWGYGYSGPGLQDGMSFQLGVALVALALIGSWLTVGDLIRGRSGQHGASHPERVENQRSTWSRSIALFMLVVAAPAIWLMSPASEALWERLPIASLVQFPWRLLGMLTFALSITAARVGDALVDPRAQRQNAPSTGKRPPSEDRAATRVPLAVYVLCWVIVLPSFAYTLPQYTEVEEWRESPQAVVRWDRFSPADRVAMVAYTEQQPSSSPMEAQYMAGEPLQVAAIIQGEGEVETLRHGGASDEIRVRATTPVVVQFYTYDYPGWQVWLNGMSIPHRHEPPYGLITVDVPAGEHHLVLRMGSTPPRIIGGVISLLAGVLILALGMPPALRSIMHTTVFKKCSQR